MEPTNQSNPENDELEIDLGDDVLTPDEPVFDSVLETTEPSSALKQSADDLLKRFPPVPFTPQENYVEPDAIVVKLIDEEILHVPFRVTTSNPALTVRLSAEIEQQSAQLIKRREQINDQLKRLNAQADVASRAMVRHEQLGFGKTSADIQGYLQAQNKVRADKVIAAQAFLKGTNAGAVAKLLNPRSKLDQVMNQKRGGSGNMRKPQPLIAQ